MNRSISHSYPDGVTVSYHENRRLADRTANVAARQKKRVVRSVTCYRDPKTGEYGRLHVVTIRPRSKWQEHAEQKGGFGIK